MNDFLQLSRSVMFESLSGVTPADRVCRIKKYNSGFTFEMCRNTIYPGLNNWWFPQSSWVSFRIVPSLRQDHLIPNDFHLFIHQFSYHSKLRNMRNYHQNHRNLQGSCSKKTHQLSEAFNNSLRPN